MKIIFLSSATAALAVAVLVLSTSCSSPPPKGPMAVHTFQQEGGGSGFGGAMLVNSVTTNATVVSLNTAQRQLLLRFPSGIEKTYRAGSEISNFDQIKVGDQVKATTVEDFAVSIV